VAAPLPDRSLAITFLLLLTARAVAYEIGQTSVTYQDPKRNSRSVSTRIFYPADVAGQGVPLASPPPGGFPVVSFGHGYLIPWDDYEFVWEGLVPDGYIVALPATETGLFPNHIDLVRDLSFIVRKLRSEGSNPSSPFYGRVAQAGAVAGHSMGGGASVLAASEDPTMTAVANLGAAETNPSAIAAAADVAVPSLLFSGANDCVTPPAGHQIPMYEALSSDCRTRISLTGASHCQFAEQNSICSLGEGGCPSPTITRQQQHDLTLLLLTPWLDYALKGDLWAWLAFEDLLDSTPGIAYESACQPTLVVGGGETAGAMSLTPGIPEPVRRPERGGLRTGRARRCDGPYCVACREAGRDTGPRPEASGRPLGILGRRRPHGSPRRLGRLRVRGGGWRRPPAHGDGDPPLVQEPDDRDHGARPAVVLAQLRDQLRQAPRRPPETTPHERMDARHEQRGPAGTRRRTPTPPASVGDVGTWEAWRAVEIL
jgi:hypothetical protein